MKFLLLGDDYKTLYVETDDRTASLRYDKNQCKWVPGGTVLFDNRLGFDSSEPEDSIYRYGNTDCMKEIREITEQEALNYYMFFNRSSEDFYSFKSQIS